MTRNTDVTSVDRPHSDSITRPSAILIPAMGLAFAGVTMALATPQYLTLAMRFTEIVPRSATGDLSILLSVGLLVQIVTLLLVGRLSDATRAHLGMRRPWMLAGLVAILAGSVALYAATSVPLLWWGYMGISVGSSFCFAPLFAMVSDQIQPRHQGLATSVLGAAGIAGSLAGFFVVQLAPGDAFSVYIVPALVALVPTILLALIVEDARLSHRIPITVGSLLRMFTVSARTSPSLAWFLPAVFLVGSVTAVVGTYSYFLVGAKVGDSIEAITVAAFYGTLISNVVAFPVSVLVGALSDRFGRRKPFFAAASVFFAAGALTVAFSDSLAVLYIGLAIVGLGTGCLFGSYMAIALEAMQDKETTARDINMVVSVYTLAGVAIPLISPTLLGPSADNYPLLLIAAAILSALSLVFLTKVRVP
ncbi:MFS transporter [Microbacterium maritypicum]